MKRYIEYVHSKEPHERRQHAMQAAGVVTAAVFAVWITTLGFRLTETTLAEDTGQENLSATAVQSLYSGPNQLIVATTTEY